MAFGGNKEAFKVGAFLIALSVGTGIILCSQEPEHTDKPPERPLRSQPIDTSQKLQNDLLQPLQK